MTRNKDTSQDDVPTRVEHELETLDRRRSPDDDVPLTRENLNVLREAQTEMARHEQVSFSKRLAALEVRVTELSAEMQAAIGLLASTIDNVSKRALEKVQAVAESLKKVDGEIHALRTWLDENGGP